MISLTDLSSAAERLREQLQQEADAKQKKKEKFEKKDQSDFRFKPVIIGKQKTVYTVRILPNFSAPDISAPPWIQTLVHLGYNKKQAKMFALCPKTHDKEAKCPICEEATKYWAKVNAKEATDTEKKLASNFNKKKRYFANVLVLKDPRSAKDGSQQGKILTWEFGDQVFNKLLDYLNDRKRFFYLPKGGYDLNVVMKLKTDEYPNYEASFFEETPTDLVSNEAELEELIKKVPNLQKAALPFAPYSYDELAQILSGNFVKKEKTFDSNSGTTVTTPTTSGTPTLNENIDIDVTPPKTNVVKMEPSKNLSDEDLLAALNDI